MGPGNMRFRGMEGKADGCMKMRMGRNILHGGNAKCFFYLHAIIMTEILNFINEELEESGIPYEYGEWTGKVSYPYFVGTF